VLARFFYAWRCICLGERVNDRLTTNKDGDIVNEYDVILDYVRNKYLGG
jgi:hypothetical protein